MALGAASGQFVLSVRDYITGQWFLGKYMMCWHRISRRLTLPAHLERCGGVETALEPMRTQRAGQNRVYRIFEEPVLAGSLRPQRLPSGLNVSTSLQVCRESQMTTNSMYKHHIIA